MPLLCRNMELELLLAKMRSATSDNVAYEASKTEVQRMMNDFTKKMQDKLDEHCSSEEQHFREKKRIDELQKRVCFHRLLVQTDSHFRVSVNANIFF